MKARFTKLAGATLALILGFSVNAADLKVGVITSLSGPISAQGIPNSQGIQAGFKYQAVVGGRKIQIIQLDDASDPSTAARNARKLIEEEKVDVLLGTGANPNSMAIAAVAREHKTPQIAYTPLSLAGEDSAWTVTTAQPAALMVAAVVDHMKRASIKSVGYIGFSDSWGDLAFSSLQKTTEGTGIQVLGNERYARADTSVTGQVLKLVATKPEAIFAGTAGTPGALPYLALAERGYRGAIYGTHGLMVPDFVRLTGTSAEGLLAPSGPAAVAEQLPDSHPSKKIAMDFRAAYQQAHNAPPSGAFSAYAFDAWLVMLNAAARVSPKIEPGSAEYRTALRDAIFATKELAVTHGVLNFKPGTPHGADKRAAVMIKLVKGQWVVQP